MLTDEDTWIPDDDGQGRGRWMQTHSGEKFYPLDPKSEEVHIRDIAHALSQICRFNGHTKSFYSVGQHSLLCAELAGCEEVAFAALLHDATEAYVGDMIRPLKWNGERMGRLFCHMEEQVKQAIALRFGILWTEQLEREVKRLDDVSLAIEAHWLMGNQPWVQELHQSLLGSTPELPGLIGSFKNRVEPRVMAFVKDEFLDLHADLQARV